MTSKSLLTKDRLIVNDTAPIWKQSPLSLGRRNPAEILPRLYNTSGRQERLLPMVEVRPGEPYPLVYHTLVLPAVGGAGAPGHFIAHLRMAEDPILQWALVYS